MNKQISILSELNNRFRDIFKLRIVFSFFRTETEQKSFLIVKG